MSSKNEFEFDLHDIPAQDRRINKFLENIPDFPDPEVQSFTDKKWFEFNQILPSQASMMHIFMTNGDLVSFIGEQMIKSSWNLLEDKSQLLIVSSAQEAANYSIQGLYSISFHFDNTLILEKENFSHAAASSRFMLLSGNPGDQGDFGAYMDKLESLHLSSKMSSFSYVLILLFILIMMVLYFTML